MPTKNKEKLLRVRLFETVEGVRANLTYPEGTWEVIEITGIWHACRLAWKWWRAGYTLKVES